MRTRAWSAHARRRSILWRIVPLGIAAAGIRYASAEPQEREAMVEQAQALLS